MFRKFVRSQVILATMRLAIPTAAAAATIIILKCYHPPHRQQEEEIISQSHFPPYWKQLHSRSLINAIIPQILPHGVPTTYPKMTVVYNIARHSGMGDAFIKENVHKIVL